MKSLSRENQADIIEAFNLTSRYLDDLSNIDNIYFDQMVDRIYPKELQLNRANSSDTEAPHLDLNLCVVAPLCEVVFVCVMDGEHVS